jgi:hypothetical protein
LRVIEESRESHRILASFNTTFIALILKLDNTSNFEEYRHIFLCNRIYKIIKNIIEIRVKSLLSKTISHEQFGFLVGRQIHEAMEVAQEVFYTIKN